MATTLSTLRQLVSLISDAVDRIEETYATAGLEFPTVDSSLDPTVNSVTFLSHSDIVKHAAVVVGAAEQLSVAVRSPQAVIAETVMAFHKSSCLGAVCKGGVAEILREAGTQGVHVNNIASRNGMSASKLARVLRLLATHNIFSEVEPNVFTNNRNSAVLDTMKSTKDLFSGTGGEKCLESAGIAAVVEHIVDDVLPSSAALTQNLFDLKTRYSEEPNHTPFNRGFRTEETFFDWLYKNTDNAPRATRFNFVMKAVEFPDAILGGGFPWGDLPVGTKIVDVGGGIGSACLPIAKAFPGLKFVIQDLACVIAEAETFWREQLPGSIESGQISIEECDFFAPQQILDADLWLLRTVIHDWPSSYGIKILKQLRNAAIVGKTKLLLVDMVLEYPCGALPAAAKEIQGAIRPIAPQPLLPNYGRASALKALLDMQVMALMHGQERTIGDHIYVTEESGWKITHMYTPSGSQLCHLLAEAV